MHNFFNVEQTVHVLQGNFGVNETFATSQRMYLNRTLFLLKNTLKSDKHTFFHDYRISYKHTKKTEISIRISINKYIRAEFDEQWADFTKRWNKGKTEKFYKYFKAVWVSSSHNKWRIFDSPPGFCKTNNSNESFNNQIKLIWTKRRKLNVLTFCNKLSSMIKYYSTANEFTHAAFATSPKPAPMHIKSAKLVKVQNKRIYFIFQEKNHR